MTYSEEMEGCNVKLTPDLLKILLSVGFSKSHCQEATKIEYQMGVAAENVAATLYLMEGAGIVERTGEMVCLAEYGEDLFTAILDGFEAIMEDAL